MLDIVAPGQWKESFAYNKNNEVTGRLAYVCEGRNVIMPELTQTLGIWMNEGLNADYSAQKKLINELTEPLSGYKSVSFALSPDNTYVLPFRWLSYHMEPGFSYRISDLSSIDAVYKNFRSTAKKNIKAALKKVSISDECSADTLWDILNKTFEAQNRKNPISRDLVYRIVEHCEKSGNGKYFEARDNEGNVHACAYFVFDEKVCYYLLGTSDSRFRSSGAQSLVLWHGIQFASEHSRAFGFEDSMVEGIEHFFKQFGGECLTYCFVKLQSLIKDVADIMKPRIKKLIGYKN